MCLSVLGLSCGPRGLPHGARALLLCHVGLASPQHVGSYFPGRDGTCIACIPRLILNHCTAREVP